MQKIIKDDYKQLYANKMVNLEEMGKFPETQPSKTEQGKNRKHKETNHSIEIETVTLKIPINKSPGIDGFTGKFCQMSNIKEELTPILLKLFPKNGRGRNSCKLIL